MNSDRLAFERWVMAQMETFHALDAGGLARTHYIRNDGSVVFREQTLRYWKVLRVNYGMTLALSAADERYAVEIDRTAYPIHLWIDNPDHPLNVEMMRREAEYAAAD